jgi:S-adenosylmethionine:tRNA-ribosyltransferase-isomerase (queuine synthetase)
MLALVANFHVDKSWLFMLSCVLFHSSLCYLTSLFEGAIGECPC